MPEAQHNKETDKDSHEAAHKQGAGDGDTGETEITTQTAGQDEADSNKDSSGKGRGFIGFVAFVALIIAIAAFVAGYISLQEIGQQQAGLSQDIDAAGARITELEAGAESIRSLAKTVQDSAQSTQDRVAAVDARVDELNQGLESGLTEAQQANDALRQALDKLHSRLSAGIDDQRLAAEARSLIQIANRQAQFNHDPSAAAAALEAANDSLSQADDPSLLAVRKAITDDIIALRNVDQVDLSDIALTLSQLEQSVDDLPLRHGGAQDDAQPAQNDAETEAVSGVSGFFSKVWNDLKGLVSVRRNSAEDTALLPPGQRFFLRQNLRLKLETARLALLQRDTELFRQSLTTATEWLQRYFDGDAAGTRNMIATLSPYQALELQPTLPDISGALKALDAWRSQQQRAANGEGSRS